MRDSVPYAATVESAIDLALCRSVFYEVLAVGFRPPTRETLARLCAHDTAVVLDVAAVIVEADLETDLRRYSRRLGSYGEGVLSRLQTSFGRLFGHTVRAVVPPYETEYGEDSLFLPCHELSDIAGFFQAFGLALDPTAHERVDHISSECEFLLFLARKEAYALECRDLQMQQDVQHATRLFLRDHLGGWAPAFGHRLAREDPEGFYGNLGGLCHAFVSADCRRLGVPAGPQMLRLRAPLGADGPMACASGGELLQLDMPRRHGEDPCTQP